MCVAAGAGDNVVRGGKLNRGEAEVDPGNTILGQGRQLTGLGVTVAVGIPPDPQSAKTGIAGVHEAIIVAVQPGPQVAEAVAVVAAEHLAKAVDDAIAVPVLHQETVYRRHPAGAFSNAITIKVEIGL